MAMTKRRTVGRPKGSTTAANKKRRNTAARARSNTKRTAARGR